MPTSYFLESVDRVMQVLNAFSGEIQEPRLTDLSLMLNMPKPQVLRIVSTLESGGFVERDPDTKRYRLGLRMFQLGMLVRSQMSLLRVARPIMEELAASTQETIAVFRVDPSGPLCIDVIESTQGLRIFAQTGRLMPWNAGAAARVILAFLPDEEREQIIRGIRYQSYTPDTVLSAASLREIIAETRAAGYALSEGELDAGAIGVSAPIFDAMGSLAGALSFIAPASRVTPEQRAEVIFGMQHGAQEISRRLGYFASSAAD